MNNGKFGDKIGLSIQHLKERLTHDMTDFDHDLTIDERYEANAMQCGNYWRLPFWILNDDGKKLNGEYLAGDSGYCRWCNFLTNVSGARWPPTVSFQGGLLVLSCKDKDFDEEFELKKVQSRKKNEWRDKPINW